VNYFNWRAAPREVSGRGMKALQQNRGTSFLKSNKSSWFGFALDGDRLIATLAKFRN